MSATATKSKKTATKPGTALAGFKMGQMMPKKPVKSGGGDAFIWIAHKMSSMWDDMAKKIRGLQNAQMVFVSGDHVELLQPMKYHLVEAFHFFAETDDQGEFTTTYDEDADNVPKTAGEYVEALIIAYTNKGARPARITFKKAMVKAVAAMLSEYQDAADPKWATRSKEHTLAAKNVPADLIGFRFYGVASAVPKTTKDGKFTYPLGSVNVNPSTSTEFDTLKDIDEEFQALLAQSRQGFMSRIGDIRSKFAQ